MNENETTPQKSVETDKGYEGSVQFDIQCFLTIDQLRQVARLLDDNYSEHDRVDTVIVTMEGGVVEVLVKANMGNVGSPTVDTRYRLD